MSDQRLKLLRVTPECVMAFLGSGEKHFNVFENALPEDAKLSHAWFDFDRRCFVMAVQSESYPEVGEGEIIPFMDNPIMVDLRKPKGFCWGGLDVVVDPYPAGMMPKELSS